MAEKEKKKSSTAIGHVSAGGSSVVKVEQSENRHKQPYRPTDLQDDARPQTTDLHHKRSPVLAVPSVAEDMKETLDLPDSKERTECEGEHKIVAKTLSSTVKRRDSSPEAILMAPIQVDKKIANTISQPTNPTAKLQPTSLHQATQQLQSMSHSKPTLQPQPASQPAPQLQSIPQLQPIHKTQPTPQSQSTQQQQSAPKVSTARVLPAAQVLQPTTKVQTAPQVQPAPQPQPTPKPSNKIQPSPTTPLVQPTPKMQPTPQVQPTPVEKPKTQTTPKTQQLRTTAQISQPLSSQPPPAPPLKTTQPIPMPVAASSDIAHDEKIEAEKKSDEDSITEEIAELRIDQTTKKEWSDDEEAGGLPRSESRTSRVSRAVRQLFCCGVPYEAPSEHDVSGARSPFSSGI